MKYDIYVVGDIDFVAFKSFSKKLSGFEDIQSGCVEVLLMSEGGSADAALAFFDRIRNSDIPVHITATGIVASAAVLLLAAGDKRRMTETAWVMVHEESVECGDMTASEMEKNAEHHRRIENQWNNLLEITTGTVAAEWAELHKYEEFLNPQDCADLGLIDEIVK